MEITIGPEWTQNEPDALVGVLTMYNVKNSQKSSALQSRKERLEQDIRQKYAGLDRSDMRAHPILGAYDRFYRQFKKTYHLQLQLESVVKGKPIASVAALVEAMFMAELEDLLLTAGHNLDAVRPPVQIDVATGFETYTLMNGEQKQLKRGDLYIQDVEGILSSVIYGPDDRTRIRLETRRVMFTTYAVPGITDQALSNHLENLRDYVQLTSPLAEVGLLEIFGG
jgi:DNA/RNA-binding domain of Phe-tRNA-synthetase-like protein